MKLKLSLFLVTLSAVSMNCTKQEGVKVTSTNVVIVKTDTLVDPIVKGDRFVTFSYNEGVYTSSNANADFGSVDAPFNVYGNATIASNTAKVKIPANTHSDTEPAPNGQGFNANIDIIDGTEYELSYKIKFDAKFEWSRGGKCGFGFTIGKGWSGCSTGNKGVGATARIMWYNPTNDANNKGADNPHFQPYLYFADKADDCGETMSKKYGNLKKDTWYTIYMRVKSNTDTLRNGLIEIRVDGTTLLYKNDVQWTTSNTGDNNLIKKINWNTFRGGSSNAWISSTDGFIYYDDVKWKKIK
jgi:hypothetical protein